MKTLDQVTEVLHAWGISHSQIHQFLDSDTAEQHMETSLLVTPAHAWTRLLKVY